MPIYKFEETVKQIAAARGVTLYSTHENLLWLIKKDLEDQKITAEEVPDKLKTHKDFRLNFSSDDFRTIVKAIK